MHLIINSLDTRRWMSDGVSSRGVEERGGEGRGMQGVCCRSGGRWRMEARARKGGGAEGRVNGEGENEGKGGRGGEAKRLQTGREGKG